MVLSLVQECFEKEFGGQLGITQPIATRWNSTLRHIQCILRLDRQKMAAVMREAEKSNLLLLPKDYTNMEELQLLLLPFLEATNQTQGEKVSFHWKTTDYTPFSIGGRLTLPKLMVIK